MWELISNLVKVLLWFLARQAPKTKEDFALEKQRMYQDLKESFRISLAKGKLDEVRKTLDSTLNSIAALRKLHENPSNNSPEPKSSEPKS